MIVCHRHRFIFLKTRKTAGTSVELALSRYTTPEDIVTTLSSESEPTRAAMGFEPRNESGLWNPFPELLSGSFRNRWKALRELFARKKFYNHAPARAIRARLGEDIWNSYFKFCFERNPYDKAISHYYWFKHRRRRPELTFEEYLDFQKLPVDFPKYSIDGEPAVDWIGRSENLAEDLSEALAHCGIEFDGWLPKAKSGLRPPESKPFKHFLDETSRKRIEATFAREIDLMGYRFDAPQPSSTWTRKTRAVQPV